MTVRVFWRVSWLWPSTWAVEIGGWYWGVDFDRTWPRIFYRVKA